MGDQVLADGLPADVVMHVHERVVILPDGLTVWLRRFRLDEQRRRIMLADGRWLAQHSVQPHTYACPLDLTHGGGARWLYRYVHTFPTWQDALSAAQAAEATWQAEHQVVTS